MRLRGRVRKGERRAVVGRWGKRARAPRQKGLALSPRKDALIAGVMPGAKTAAAAQRRHRAGARALPRARAGGSSSAPPPPSSHALALTRRVLKLVAELNATKSCPETPPGSRGGAPSTPSGALAPDRWTRARCRSHRRRLCELRAVRRRARSTV